MYTHSVEDIIQTYIYSSILTDKYQKIYSIMPYKIIKEKYITQFKIKKNSSQKSH